MLKPIGIGVPFSRSVSGGGSNPDFISTWDTTKAGSASDTVVLPLQLTGTYSGTIDWGDGNTSPLSYANRSYTYPGGAGTYTITITGTIQGWRFANGGDKLKITNISNWGTLDISTDQAFFGCSNMECNALDAPIISSTTLAYTFFGCSKFNGVVNDWDVSSVTNIERFVMNASVFNQDFDRWNTSSVTIASNMFTNALAFNGDLSNLDLTGVVTATGFLQNTSFNNTSINSLDVSNIQIFNNFFRETDFNQDITGWNMSAATRTDQMFYDNNTFNQAIGVWNMSNNLRVDYMFFNADAFNQDISSWDVNQMNDFTSFMQSATGLSTANYDALLIAWDAQGAMSYSGTVNFGGSQYTSGGAAEAARTSLISKWGGITDGGPA